MKKQFHTIALLFVASQSISQIGNVGIGTQKPLARLHIVDSSVLFSAEGSALGSPSNPPSISTYGRQMMWYAGKGAFRSGYFGTSHLQKDSIGNYSTALGFSTKAIGADSLAAGYASIAVQAYTIAFGNSSIARAEGSMAAGNHNITDGEYAVAMGTYSAANGNNSIAMGNAVITGGNCAAAFNFNTRASGDFSAAFNYNCQAKGEYSTAMGRSSIASGQGSSTLGIGTWATSYGETAVGLYNLSYEAAGRVFSVGIGTAEQRRNALTVLNTGYIGIGTVNPDATLSVEGTASKTGGGVWYTFSDRRVKKNIEDYKPGLKEILAIRPVSFQYNELSGYTNLDKRYVGVIAQEIEKVLPATVTLLQTDSSLKDKRQFDGSGLTYTLINAIKEQQVQIAALQAELGLVRNESASTIIKNKAMEQRLANIEAGWRQK